jgi:hypothetical protein
MAYTLNPLSGEFDYYIGLDVTDARYLKLDGSNDPITGNITINTNSTTALLVEQDGVKDNVLVIDTTNARIGINTIPLTDLHIGTNSASIPPTATIESATSGSAGNGATLVLERMRTNSSFLTSTEELGKINFSGQVGATPSYSGTLSVIDRLI